MGLSSVRHQAITWTNAAFFLNRPLGLDTAEIWNKQQISLKKVH